MKKYKTILWGFACVELVCLIVGFMVVFSNSGNGSTGMGILLSGCILGLFSLIPMIKLHQFQREQKRSEKNAFVNKMKKLEEEVNLLKNK